MKTVQQELDAQGILVISLNRPDKLNALSQEVLEELQEIFAYAEKENKVKALLITGNGKAFCAGADINRLAECTTQTGFEFARFGQAVFRQLETLSKPSVAAINGYAFGGGCELAMAATIRIASEQAKFGQPEVKLGIIPGYGGTQRLARLVGKGRALDLCLTGRFIDAGTADSWGLVTKVVSSDNLLVEAKEILATMLTMAPLAIASTMTVIDRGFDMNLDDALHLEAIHFANLCATEDKNRGVNAFLEKRPADFKGK